MQVCSKCDWNTWDTTFKFCPKCSSNLRQTEVKKYGGVGEDHGTYRITCVLEQEFFSKDSADECGYKTVFGYGKGYDRATSHTVELVKLTATPETHPFKCVNCYVYAESNDVYCDWCGFSDWEKR